MNLVMPAGYSLQLVTLSFVIAALGSFVAVTVSARIVDGRRRVSTFNVLTAATALGGIGVWSMHFIGMLALRLNMGVSYSMVETLVSLVAAIVLSAAALTYVARGRTLMRVLGAGIVLGLGVCVMHYLGMLGMRFGGYIQWSWLKIAASVLIAIVAATAALWLAFEVRNLGARVVASLVMAAAVCTMHYTGMDAATFVCTTATPAAYPQGAGLVSSLQLPVLVSVVAFGLAFVILIDQAFQRLEARQHVAVPRNVKTSVGGKYPRP